MPKRVISFKPTAECEVQLAELMGRWGCDRTAAIVRAVAVALDAHSQVSWETKPKDLKEVAEAVRTIKPPAKRGAVEPKKLSEAVADTRSQQERMDDFYRANMAKGKKS